MPLPLGSETLIDRWFVDNGLIKPSDFTKRIEIFHDLIMEWSSRMNIVSKNDLDHLLERHILDSLTPLDIVPETGRLIDIGSGGGFPGIPIAICCSKVALILLESRHKKVLFLEEARKRLKLSNIVIEESRLEDFQPDKPYDIALIRALPRWKTHLNRIKALLRADGRIVYYKKPGEIEVISS